MSDFIKSLLTIGRICLILIIELSVIRLSDWR